ncbi:Fumarylacetoacetate hydrolase family protein [Cronobacter muytjensii 530]
MKLASYLHQGRRSYGIVTDKGVVDLGSRLGARYADLKTLLARDALDEALLISRFAT